MSLKLIEEIIDIPFMDTKNISKIIYSYCKYNILEDWLIDYIEISIDNSNLEYFSDRNLLYCKINNYYYLLENWLIGIQIQNGKLFSEIKSKNNKLKSIDSKPEDYIFLIRKEPQMEYYDIYRIFKKFNNKNQFQNQLRFHLQNYKKLLYNGFIPEKSSDDEDNLKSIKIYFNGIDNILWKFENIDEDEIVDSFESLRNIGIDLGNKIENIINLID